MVLNNNDYIKILNYYKLPISTSNKKIKKDAENILAVKLCRCIKKITPLTPNNEARAIGVCTRSIFKKKGLTRKTFKCTKGRSVKFDKFYKKTRKMYGQTT